MPALPSPPAGAKRPYRTESGALAFNLGATLARVAASGADTRAVLDGLGLSADQIAGLVAAGIVQETQA